MPCGRFMTVLGSYDSKAYQFILDHNDTSGTTNVNNFQMLIEGPSKQHWNSG